MPSAIPATTETKMMPTMIVARIVPGSALTRSHANVNASPGENAVGAPPGAGPGYPPWPGG